nr:hypothetical protein [Tanacetum cinerariifolium]
MRTHSYSNLPVESPPNPSTSNPKHRNCKRSKQPFILEESPIDTMTDKRTMAELLRACTKGYAEAIVVPLILAEQFELKHSLINMMTSDPFFRLEKDNPHDHIRSGSLPSNTIANPKSKLKAITTRSGIVLDGPSIPIPSPFINPKEYERVEETLTDQDLAEDPLYPNILCPSRMLKQKQQEKDEAEIHKFGQMFKQLHINITLADALILIPKYQKMLKALLSNKEKLLKLANTPLNENCSAVILKKLPEKLGDPGKFLIPYGFSKLKCKALADPGASINLMPLSVWKKLEICTPAGIARDVFILIGKFTFPSDFVIVDYESDPRVPLILGRPFLRTARTLIDVHREEIILHDVKDDVFDPDRMLKLLFPSHIPVEDSDSFLEKSDTSLFYSGISLPEFENFIIYMEETNSGNFIPSDNSLPEFETFYFDIEEKNSGSTTIHADISLPDLECFNFDFKPDPCELTSIIDFGIRENKLSATNVNLPPEEDHSPLFAYVVWIFLSFLTYHVVPPHLFSFGNEDTIFDPGITNYHFPSLLLDVFIGVVRFRKKRKLAPRFVGPFKIIEKKYLADLTPQVPLDEIRVDAKLNFMEELVEILEREFKKLKRSRIAIVKVRWNLKRGSEFTWEREDQMKLKYPHLFSDISG